MRRLTRLAAMAGLGATAMWLLDSRRGAARRAMLRDRTGRMVRLGERELVRRLRDLEHRARGLLFGALDLFGPSREVPDDVLHEHVRAVLGHRVGNAHAIQVSVNDGYVLLVGPILAAQVAGLVRALRRVPGVHEVDTTHLEQHESAAGVPGLQGHGPMVH